MIRCCSFLPLPAKKQTLFMFRKIKNVCFGTILEQNFVKARKSRFYISNAASIHLLHPHMWDAEPFMRSDPVLRCGS